MPDCYKSLVRSERELWGRSPVDESLRYVKVSGSNRYGEGCAIFRHRFDRKRDLADELALDLVPVVRRDWEALCDQ